MQNPGSGVSEKEVSGVVRGTFLIVVVVLGLLFLAWRWQQSMEPAPVSSIQKEIDASDKRMDAMRAEIKRLDDQKRAGQ